MAEDPNDVPSSRLSRWIILGALIVAAVALYFRDGARVVPFGSTPVAADSAAAPAPAAPTPR